MPDLQHPQFVDIDLDDEEDSSDEEYCPDEEEDDDEEEEDTAEEVMYFVPPVSSDLSELEFPPKLFGSGFMQSLLHSKVY